MTHDQARAKAGLLPLFPPTPFKQSGFAAFLSLAQEMLPRPAALLDAFEPGDQNGDLSQPGFQKAPGVRWGQ